LELVVTRKEADSSEIVCRAVILITTRVLLGKDWTRLDSTSQLDTWRQVLDSTSQLDSVTPPAAAK
jgi:hypothetical protein